jgi:hypothetical protein
LFVIHVREVTSGWRMADGRKKNMACRRKLVGL